MTRRLTCIVAALCLAGCAIPGRAAAPRMLRVLVFSGQNNHNWKATTPYMKQMLEATGRFQVDVTDTPGGMTAEQFAPYDAILDNYNGKPWGKPTEDALTAFIKDHGKGYVVIHAANNKFGHWKEYEVMIGGAWRAGSSHGSMHRFNVRIVDGEHPITKGMTDFYHAIEEFYHRMRMHDTAHVIAQAFSSKKYRGTDKIEPIAWVVSHGKGRVFQTVLGHDVRGMKGTGFIALVTRGTEWAATGKATIPIPPLEPPKAGLPESPQPK